MRKALQERVRRVKANLVVLYFAYRDERTPLVAKLVVVLVLAYAVSPIDLIPDFIPVIGYLDDAVLVPLGIALALRLIPKAVLDEHRERVDELALGNMPWRWFGAGLVVFVWAVAGLLIVRLVLRT